MQTIRMASIHAASDGLSVAACVLVLLFMFFSFVASYGKKQPTEPFSTPKAFMRIIGLIFIAVSYVGDAIISLRRNDGHQLHNRFISMSLLALAWGFAGCRKPLLNSDILSLSSISLLVGIPLLVLDAVQRAFVRQNLPSLVIQGVRLAASFALFIDGITQRKHDSESAGEEPLLRYSDDDASSEQAVYGTNPRAAPTRHRAASDTSNTDSDDGEGSEDQYSDTRVGELRKSGSWMVYLQNFEVFLPHLIPKKNIQVQACLFICVLCLIASRFLNVLVPRQLGIVAEKLIAGEFAYVDLGIYLLLALINDESGVGLVQSLAKVPIEQFSYRQLTNAAFNHVMNLGMDFHSDRDSAEVMKSIEQGEALTNILETGVLEILPTVVDMVVAFVFLYVKFNSSIALCMVVASLAFLSLEVVTSGWNIDNRRCLTKSQRQEAKVMHQAVQGWQTVSAFNRFSYEKFRFGTAVNRHMTAKQNFDRRDALINGALEGLVPVTFCALASLVINEIYHGRSSAGDFVFLIQYWDYLIWPIKYLMHDYRYLLRDLVDAEQLLDLLTTEPTVADKEGALVLSNVEGRVEFADVAFSYDTKKFAVHDINITAKAGETIAFVGATGAGKSSLMKLLMRYFDVTSGSIKIDGHDLRDVTQGSLRDALGVVSQDPLLFNASIMDNLQYAKLSASDDEIFQACRAAAIHDKILSFTDGYSTKVGEQGVKLSGGEIQRLAIARSFLKDPPILILDEATSAVDTETESEIQTTLYKLSRKRTTFVIAHRLSTIVRADQLLVVDDGTIIERGTHTELLEKKGKYYNLWQKQLGTPQAKELLLQL